MYSERFLLSVLAPLGVTGYVMPTMDSSTWAFSFKDSATDAQKQQVQQYITGFDYMSVETTLVEIAELENAVTPRLLQAAIAADTTVDSVTGKTAIQTITDINSQKTVLRRSLPTAALIV